MSWRVSFGAPIGMTLLLLLACRGANPAFQSVNGDSALSPDAMDAAGSGGTGAMGAAGAPAGGAGAAATGGSAGVGGVAGTGGVAAGGMAANDAGAPSDAAPTDVPPQPSAPDVASEAAPDVPLPIEAAAMPVPYLLGYWPLDDNLGSATARDVSSHRRDATIQGASAGVAFIDDAVKGRVLSLPGGIDPQLGALIPYSTEINEMQEFTVSAWFKLANPVPLMGQRSIISRQQGTTSKEIFNLTCNVGDLVVYIPGDGSQVNFEARAKGAVRVGVWMHAAATYDTRWLRIYVDGAEKHAVDLMPRNRLVSSVGTPVYIGNNRNTNDGNVFDGQIDEVALYSKAMSPATILQLSKKVSPLEIR
jgi:hypothetical protein